MIDSATDDVDTARQYQVILLPDNRKLVKHGDIAHFVNLHETPPGFIPCISRLKDTLNDITLPEDRDGLRAYNQKRRDNIIIYDNDSKGKAQYFGDEDRQLIDYFKPHAYPPPKPIPLTMSKENPHLLAMLQRKLEKEQLVSDPLYYGNPYD
jgi:hypothetical protein